MKVKLVILLLYLIKSLLVTIVYSQECYDILKSLSSQDRCLSSRSLLRDSILKISNSSSIFINLMRNQTCNGSDISASGTVGWVSEIFEGIEAKYSLGEFKTYIGSDIQNLFNQFKSNSSRLVYEMKIKSTIENHSWVIEQLKNASGWRIYQSYDKVYSLKPWLSENITGMYYSGGNASNYEIFTAQPNLKSETDTLFRLVTNGDLFLKSNPNISTPYEIMRPYFMFINDFYSTNSSKPLEYFKTSRNLYGKGQVLSSDQFNQYLSMLSELTRFYYDNFNYDNQLIYINNTLSFIFSQNFNPKNMTQEIWNYHINLFGLPDMLVFPNITSNYIASYLRPQVFNSSTYTFQIRVSVLPDNLNCMSNNVFMNYLTTDAWKINLNHTLIMGILFLFLII
jgi:hypothetical protein